MLPILDRLKEGSIPQDKVIGLLRENINQQIARCVKTIKMKETAEEERELLTRYMDDLEELLDILDGFGIEGKGFRKRLKKIYKGAGARARLAAKLMELKMKYRVEQLNYIDKVVVDG